MNNKKAVSAVVATVLIILITIAAVTIIWAAIIPMIQNQLAGSGDCLDSSGHMSLNEDTTCYNLGCVNATGWFNKTNVVCGTGWTNATQVQLGVKRLQGVFDSTGIVAKIFVGGKTVSQKVSQVIGTNTEDTIIVVKNASELYNSLPSRLSYAPLIKPAGGTAEKECPNVRETVAKLCA